ncbi:hypothetical protein BGZ98_007967 [Dissophora globulifera]|nr:hypothetical protein BGZ98_007967 [Dissophora globulifera]
MATAEVQQEWRSGDLIHQSGNSQGDQTSSPGDVDAKPSSLLPALPVDGKVPSGGQHADAEVTEIEAKVESLGVITPPPSTGLPSEGRHTTSRSSTGISYPSPPPMHHAAKPTTNLRQSALFDNNNSDPPAKLRGSNLPTPLQMPISQQGGASGRATPLAGSFTHSPVSSASDSSAGSLPPQQPWMSNGPGSPRHGPLLTPGMSSPALMPHPTGSYGGSSNSLPLPDAITPSSRKSSIASIGAGGLPRVSPGFRGAPLGQTSDTESVLKQFDVYFGKVYLRGQLQKKNELGVEGFKLQGQQWAAYTAELIGPKLRLRPMDGSSGPKGQEEEMNMEEARVEIQDGPNGGTFTINWMGANKAVFQPVQQLSLGSPEVGSRCQDWVCAIRLSCYECSRLQEIYTSTLLRRPKFRDQVAATIEGSIKAEGMLRVKFWAGDEWQRVYVVVSDQRGEEVKKKKQGKILQASPIRGQIHFYENSKSRRPFVSMYNVSQAYAVCPTRSSINASKDNKVDEEGSLTIKLEGDVVLQRENLTPSRKGFFSSPSPPSSLARDLQALLPTGRAMFAMFQVSNAVERTKFLLGTSEAFRIYGKPGPLLFDSPTDPAAMNFGCMASSLLQQELLIGLDAVLHLPQKGESLADVKFSFGEVLRKRLIAENPPAAVNHQHRFSTQYARRGSMPFNAGAVADNLGSPSPMMMMAMRSRANSGSGFLVPQPSPGLHPLHMSPRAGAQLSPQLGPYSSPQFGPYSSPQFGPYSSPRQGPLHASPYNQHLHRSAYAPSNTSTDENDANLATDDEGEDDEYPDTPEEEDDGMTTPFRSRSGSLMAPSLLGYAQVRKGSVGALSLQSGRAGRSGSFASAYGVQVVAPEALVKKSTAVLELPSLNSFSDDFGIQADANKDKQKRLTAVVYPTQIVIPKSKKRRESMTGDNNGQKSALTPTATVGGAPSPSINVSGEEGAETQVTEDK